MSSTPTPPAIKHYWLGKAYRDMFATSKEAHSLNVAAAKELWDGIGEYDSLAMRGFDALQAFAALCVAPMIVWMIIVPIHFIIVCFVGMFIMTGYLCVSLAEKCYVAFHGWTTVCKYCGNRIHRVEYQCSSCSRWHGNLQPSSFGILKHQCRCGQKLSCSFLGDRHNLRARCPHEGCHKDLDASVETRSYTSVICIIGPPSSGKTGFMIAAMQAMWSYIAPRFLLKGRFNDKMSERFFQEEKKYITQTGSTRKTISEKPPAFNAVFESADGKFLQQVYFFDAAGEIFLTSDKLAAQYQFKNITGGVIIVDPFSLPLLHERYGDKLRELNLDTRITQEDLVDVVERFIIGMQRHFGLDPNRRIKTPFAVIVTKTDLGKLHRLLRPEQLGGDPIAISKHIRRYIDNWGGTGLTHFLESKFENIQYFAASPILLRRTKDGDTAQLKSGTLASPLMWMLETARDPIMKRTR
ncbi:MAG: hypothetical protein KDB00_13385 [Planctomycetales bacterium]|nr:hypothetical protein [Planctomycetales bacterium]